MPYDIQTIGSLVSGTCTCGGHKGLSSIDPVQLAGLWDSAKELWERWSPQGIGRRAGEVIKEKAEDIAEQLPEKIFDPLPPTIELIGAPTWGRHVGTVGAVAGVIGVGAAAVVGYKYLAKGRRRAEPRSRKGRRG